MRVVEELADPQSPEFEWVGYGVLWRLWEMLEIEDVQAMVFEDLDGLMSR